MIATLFDGWNAKRRAWRRARNLRAGKHNAASALPAARLPAGPGFWLGLAACLLAVAGGIVIASHARALAAAAPGRTYTGGAVRPLAAFQPALPGIAFSVPAEPGVDLSTQQGGALLILSGMRAQPPVVIDLCSQVLEGSGGRLAPLRIGYRFADVARWAARNEAAASPVTLRNVVLAASGMPQVDITGAVGANGALRLAWQGGPARWVGDATSGAVLQGERGQAPLGREGWLVWAGDGALRVTRRPGAGCAAGELVLTRYRAALESAPAAATGALVAAFPERGSVRSTTLAPGAYRVPAAAPARLEDGALFDSLLARGLVRLDGGAQAGLIEVAPRDLARWRAAAASQRTADLRAWDRVVLDDDARRLLERLHGRADGAYVREQVRIFNSERRLLAWRVRPGTPGAWQAQAGGVALAHDAPMPLAASRLFERLPAGWAPWRRVADWPAGAGAGARLVLALPAPASGTEQFAVLLAGRVRAVEGARLVAQRPACGGRACARPDDVSELLLAPVPGSRRIVVEATPLDLAGMAGAGAGAGAGDAAWRHLRVEEGRLAWRPLAPSSSQPHEARPAAAPILLADRKGRPLWQSGSATPAAQAAGLAPLLGLHEQHASSIAGMLAMLPAPEGAHTAALTLDLDLQAAAQGALECAGLRRGSWDGVRCHGGAAPPPGRQAGLVLLDTGSGDILAAAGAGGGVPPGASWPELRDFDRVDPARSPLRQAALQHDGGAERSPGSTFKIVSALGLELAAQRDPRLDAVLGGMPLAALDGMAASRGFDFRTDAASYPASGRLARITNFRDGTLARRAQDGRLGLAEALTFSLNTWFAWTAELGDASLFGKATGGAPSLRALDPEALAGVRPIADMARRLGFDRPLALDGGLLPAGYGWRSWDALQASAAASDPIGARHELRQMAIGLRMQATPLHMAMVAGAVGEGRAIVPRLLLSLDGKRAQGEPGAPLGVRLDRVRAGLQGVVTRGTAAGAFRAPEFDGLRGKLYGKTGTAPSGPDGQATVWFTGWLEPGSLPGQTRRLAFAVFVSRSEATGGEHAAPVVAALLRALLAKEEPKR